MDNKVDSAGVDMRGRSEPPAERGENPGQPLPPLRSVHTSNFPAILEELGIALLVTTYQAGRLVMLRADGGVLNTHFRSFSKPMGLAADEHRLAIGTMLEIWEFHNAPAVGRRLAPAGKHDSCYLPRSSLTTGDIQVHEMAWGRNEGSGIGGQGSGGGEDELWFINTRFSCLCTRDAFHSFVPRWRPPFITELAPEDRCHLNGLGMVEGVPTFVTALGECDDKGGWRRNKKNGGILMELPSSEVILRGLSMPHSPRWHQGRLWLLESGSGTLGTVDLARGRYDPIVELGGFTRGLAFHGSLAFIGLSQVRETAIFSGIPITERLKERTCGVWVVNIHTGETVAFLRFEDAVQEIFAVEVLSGSRFPEVINDNSQLIADSFVLPDEALEVVPSPLRFRARPPFAEEPALELATR